MADIKNEDYVSIKHELSNGEVVTCSGKFSKWLFVDWLDQAYYRK